MQDVETLRAEVVVSRNLRSGTGHAHVQQALLDAVPEVHLQQRARDSMIWRNKVYALMNTNHCIFKCVASEFLLLRKSGQMGSPQTLASPSRQVRRIKVFAFWALQQSWPKVFNALELTRTGLFEIKGIQIACDLILLGETFTPF